MEQLNTTNVLADSWGEHDQQIRGRGWAVANAPRPLVGRVTWTGPFRHGIFYAAGPLGDLGEAWRCDDARLLVEVTPTEVVDQLAAYITGNGYSLAEFADIPGMLDQAAADLDLPWDAVCDELAAARAEVLT